MLLSYKQLIEQVLDKGYLQNADYNNVNGTSIDIRLGGTIFVEEPPEKVRCPKCGKEYRTQGILEYPLTIRVENTRSTCESCKLSRPLREWVIPINLSDKQPLNMRKVSLTYKGYILAPGEAILAHTVETFHLPRHITAEYRLKSSAGRMFLEHLHAAWCDPGWHNSVLTLELANLSRFHHIRLQEGDKIGQVMFYSHEPVPEGRDYSSRGQYNNSKSVEQSRGSK